MSGQDVTKLLMVFLALSIIILFVLIVVFIILSVKKKQKESDNNNTKVKTKDITPNTNIIQTKMYTSENIKKFMDFDDIKDNMIIQKDGKRLVMVIKCQGVNYDLMSSIEKVGVEQGFIQFLNTLTRPIQLYVQARKVNLE